MSEKEIKEEIFADIRNKLTPFKNLIAMLEYGIKDSNIEISPKVKSYITDGIEDCKKSIEYLSDINSTDKKFTKYDVKILFDRYNEFISHHDIEEWKNWIEINLDK